MPLRRSTLVTLAGAAAILACGSLGAVAQPAPAGNLPAKVSDGRAQDELKAGVPPEGARIPANVPRGPGSLTGVWYNDQFRTSAKFLPEDLVVRTKDGELPPMLPWAAALEAKRLADAKAGHPLATTKSRCLPAGLPMSMLSPKTLGLRFIEEPKMITVLIEELDNFRQIRLGGRHPETVEPSYLGHSVGHWEGDTLVVDTVGLDTDTSLDNQGMPHSDALHVIERWRRISMDRLEVKITIDDPKTFAHPWELPRRTLKLEPGGEINEYLCANQRNASSGGVTGVQMPGGH